MRDARHGDRGSREPQLDAEGSPLTSARTKPHARSQAQRRAQSKLTPDQQWARDIAKLLLASCHPKQRAFVEDPHRRVAALVGRGGGKTTAWKARALIKLTSIARARLRYVALSRPDAEELLWEPLKFTIEELSNAGIPNLVIGKDVFFSEVKLRLTIARTGGELQLVGADDKKEISKLRGKPFHEVGLDEAASHDPLRVDDLLFRAVGPRLGDYRGAFVMFGTPGPRLQGEFYKATCPGGTIDGVLMHRPYERRNDPEFAGWQGWSSHAWALTDPDAQKIPQLANVWSEALITKDEQRWSDNHPTWRREYLGEWAADNTENIYQYRAFFEGQRWNSWTPEIDGTTGFAKLPDGFKDWHFGYGADMGSKDPFALNVFAFSPSDTSRTLYHVYSFGRTQMYARAIAKLLIGEEAVVKTLRGEQVNEKEWKGAFAVTGWPAAFVADLAHLGEAVILELGNVYGIRIKAAEKKGKHATIEGANGDLADGRIKVIAGSELEKQLETLQWKKDEYDQVKEGKGDRNDHADSFIYVRREIVSLFAAGVVVAPSKPAEPVYTDPMQLGSGETGEYDSLLSDADFGDNWGNT